MGIAPSVYALSPGQGVPRGALYIPPSGSGPVTPFVTDTSWDASGTLAGHATVGGGTWTVRNSGVSTQASTFTFSATQTTGPGGLMISSSPATADGCAEAQIWVTNASGPETNGPAIRVQTASNGNLVWLQMNASGPNIDLFERFSNTVTQIANISTGIVKPTTQPGKKYALCGSGTTINVYQDGVLMGSGTTQVTANGRLGLFGYFNNTNASGANYRINGFWGYDSTPY
jgi:hypothetical protein